jgi:hypothetical protein
MDQRDGGLMDLWLLLIVMSLATYRLTRFVVEDTFPPMLWVRHKLVGGWTGPDEETPVYRARWVPQWLADLLSCPYCASGWIAAGVTAGVWAVAGLPVPLLCWVAVWAVGGLLAAQEWA